MGQQPDNPPLGVLFDRDGTLVEDEPYNADPALVRSLPGARQVLEALRRAGVPVGIVSNQSGVARGLITAEQLDAVNARVEELLGPFDSWSICPHGPDDGCECRKPEPGMVFQSARHLGIPPWDLALIGDIGADIDAAHAAGARSVLVPTPVTRQEEVDAAPAVAADIVEAIRMLFPPRSAVARELDTLLDQAEVAAESRR